MIDESLRAKPLAALVDQWNKRAMARQSINRNKARPNADEYAVRPEPTVRIKKVVKPTRAERAVILKEKIFRAGAQIVGELGYQDASVARITQLAGIAQGTFYLYFETRQHLFDQLLPHAGQDMMHYIGERVQGSSSYMEVEERGVHAFFAYLQENPGFYRLLNEAEFAAPIAHKKHMEQLVEHYISSMKRSLNEGQLSKFHENELKTIAYTSMAYRSYIYLAYVKYGDNDYPPKNVVETYMKLLRSGIG